VRKGFTLIELLVVIAILAILATVVVLVLNPAELLRQARDSNRISDLGSLHSAISLFLADVTTSTWVSGLRCTAATTTPPGGGTCTVSTSTAINGTGWVPINFSAISSGSPLGKLPIDPVNDSVNFYAYRASTSMGLYKLYANMESAKFSSGGGSDVESNNKDGGNVSNWYEIGSDMTL